MYIPLYRECVRVEGRRGLFMVLAPDYKAQCADLIGVSSKEELKRISFASLFEISEDPEPLAEREDPRPC
jgi:hypothetical protein